MKKKISNQDPVFAGDYEYLPEGTYQAVAIRHEISEYFGNRKLYLWFQIIDGVHAGKELFMPFNFPLKISRNSKYFKSWLVANKGIRPAQNNCLSRKIFMKKVFTVKTKTVIKGSEGSSLSVEERYSIVDKLIEVSCG